MTENKPDIKLNAEQVNEKKETKKLNSDVASSLTAKKVEVVTNNPYEKLLPQLQKFSWKEKELIQKSFDRLDRKASFHKQMVSQPEHMVALREILKGINDEIDKILTTGNVTAASLIQFAENKEALLHQKVTDWGQKPLVKTINYDTFNDKQYKEDIFENTTRLSEAMRMAMISENLQTEEDVLNFRAQQTSLLLKSITDGGQTEVQALLQRYLGQNAISLSTVEMISDAFMSPEEKALKKKVEELTGTTEYAAARKNRIQVEYAAGVVTMLIASLFRYQVTKGNFGVFQQKDPTWTTDTAATSVGLASLLLGSVGFGQQAVEHTMQERNVKLLMAVAKAGKTLETNPSDPKAKEQYTNALMLLSLDPKATIDSKSPQILQDYKAYETLRDSVKTQPTIENKKELDAKKAAFENTYGIDLSIVGDYAQVAKNTKLTNQKEVQVAHEDEMAQLSPEARTYLKGKLSAYKVDEQGTKLDAGQVLLSLGEQYDAISKGKYTTIKEQTPKAVYDALQAFAYNKEFDKYVKDLPKEEELQKLTQAQVLKEIEDIRWNIWDNVPLAPKNAEIVDLQNDLRASLGKTPTAEQLRRVLVQARAIRQGKQEEVRKQLLFDKQKSTIQTLYEAYATTQETLTMAGEHNTSLDTLSKISESAFSPQVKAALKILWSVKQDIDMQAYQGGALLQTDRDGYEKKWDFIKKYPQSKVVELWKDRKDPAKKGELQRMIENITKDYTSLDKKTYIIEGKGTRSLFYDDVLHQRSYIDDANKNYLEENKDTIEKELAEFGRTIEGITKHYTEKQISIGTLNAYSFISTEDKKQLFNTKNALSPEKIRAMYAQGKKRADMLDALLTEIKDFSDNGIAAYLEGKGMKNVKVGKPSPTSYAQFPLITQDHLGTFAIDGYNDATAEDKLAVANALHTVLGKRGDKFKGDSFTAAVLNAFSNQPKDIMGLKNNVLKLVQEEDLMEAMMNMKKYTGDQNQRFLNSGLQYNWSKDITIGKWIKPGEIYESTVYIDYKDQKLALNLYFKQDCVNVVFSKEAAVVVAKDLYKYINDRYALTPENNPLPKVGFEIGQITDDELSHIITTMQNQVEMPAYMIPLLSTLVGSYTPEKPNPTRVTDKGGEEQQAGVTSCKGDSCLPGEKKKEESTDNSTWENDKGTSTDHASKKTTEKNKGTTVQNKPSAEQKNVESGKANVAKSESTPVDQVNRFIGMNQSERKEFIAKQMGIFNPNGTPDLSDKRVVEEARKINEKISNMQSSGRNIDSSFIGTLVSDFMKLAGGTSREGATQTVNNLQGYINKNDVKTDNPDGKKKVRASDPKKK